jgi:hypothetical protein
MAVLVDSCVWSLVFRRTAANEVHRAAIARLLRSSQARMIGPIRQECLSGVRDPASYAAVRDKLRAIDDVPLLRDDYELAASYFNTCRAKGIQGAHTDFLICAVADRLHFEVYTTDNDFDLYAAHVPLRRFSP